VEGVCGGMENQELARIFDEIADILEIQRGNPYRIRSFRRVSQVLSNLGFRAADAALSNPRKLLAVPGIGEGTLKKILEILETGECKEHQELVSQMPPSLVSLLRLPNVGPRKIALFWKSLNIRTIEELEKAARENRLRELPGMAEKSEEKILHSISEWRQSGGRFRLDTGIQISRSLAAYLKSRIEPKQLAVAGSIRRMRDTVGDMDILITTEEPSQAMDTFLRYPGALSVLAQGETKSSILLSQGLQADLRVVAPSSFGAALQYFTGSKDHNVALRERAKRLGLKISEYGLFRLQDGSRIAGESEAEIYRHLGLTFIPPELRENRGELEKAETDQLPELIELKDIRGDLHLHTLSSDGRDSIETMVVAAKERGYEYVAITDHGKALPMIQGLDESKLLRQIEEIEEIAGRHPDITILKGIEVDILEDGGLDLQEEVLERLDLVIASIHRRFGMTRQQMTRRICRALERPCVNILAHPSGRLLLKRAPYEFDFPEVVKTARENRVALEINGYPARLDLNDTMARTARDSGALLVINTDGHDRDMLRYMDYGVATARRGWLEPRDVINALPLDELRRVLKKQE
jgi:DNA polymerase (family X)